MLRNLQSRVAAPRIARILAVTGTMVVIYLHILFGMNAGALWRDEVNSLEVATMRTFAEMWANLSFDSFPALFFVILRLFAGVPASVSDGSLRVFGAAIGLLILAAVWLNARWLRLGFPLITLALIGFNPMVIRYGDSIRAYGLGILLALLTIGAMWRLIESFTLRHAIVAVAIAVLSVQCLYYNAVLLFALCLAAATVTLRRRQIVQTLTVFAIGAVAAASLLPYVPTMQRVRSCSFMWKEPFTVSGVWTKAAETLGSPLPFGGWLWLMLLTTAVVIGLWAVLRKPATTENISNDDRLLFALAALLLGVVCYTGFLRILSYATQPWYYVVLVAFVATCIEMIFSSVGRTEKTLLVRSACALLLMGASLVPALQWLEGRQTNIDIIAAKLAKVARPDDLIVINTWFYGITFHHYYHGTTSYVTFPPMEDLRTHRVDIAKQQMMSTQPMAPVFRRMAEVLHAGHTVWLIGGLNYVTPGRRPLFVRPGFDGPDGWVGGGYYTAWSEQASFLVQTYAKALMPIPVPCDQPVVRYEDVPLTAIRGWRSGVGRLEVLKTSAPRLSDPINPSLP
jgi:hypothetical protein